MRTEPISNSTFGKIYYGIKNEKLSATQRDALEDITAEIQNSGYDKKLENINCDIYIEPDKKGFGMRVAVLNDAKIDLNGNLKCSKIVLLGGFAESFLRRYVPLSENNDIFPVETITQRLKEFFKGYHRKKFIEHVNIL